MRPLIGIPPCLDERGRWKPGRAYHYIDSSYARAVAEAGGLPVYLPHHADARALLEGLDGLLLPGGGDFAPPAPYPAAVRFDPVPPEQLAFDRELLAGALSRELPLLAVCYGMQLLALERGGTLLYDIAHDAPGAARHDLPEGDGRHAVRIEPGSRLAAALGEGEAQVNSLHHQAVADPGALAICARSADGLVEAVEDPRQRFCVGVQWHPEKLAEPHAPLLFEALVAAAAR